MKFIWIIGLFIIGCSGLPMFNQDQVRPWQNQLAQEAPSLAPFIAIHSKGNYKLYYLAAHHQNSMNSDTLKLVERLFKDYKFNAIIIEPFANTLGESPEWYVTEAQAGISEDYIRGGESALAAIRAYEKKIPFFGGEIDHKEMFNRLKKFGYSKEDIIGFYLARQIPQMIRQKERLDGLLERKGPGLINQFCIDFEINHTQCPSLSQLKKWYFTKNGKELNTKVTSEDVAPQIDGKLFTHKISSSINNIRDRYTLEIIYAALIKYKKVAIIYGSSHYLTLKKSIESSMGPSEKIICSHCL